MKFGSVCSGIEAASVAFEPLGFTAQWFSEIEHFPSEVLKHRYPTVPNLGDMTKLTQNETFRASSIDLLVGGTPCQSFSVAGLRRGLADPRGNLMLTFLALADAKKPRWIVWENVPGVLSSNGGRDFGTFLGALGELGYGFAYRVLDAQYFGVAQRRRRVFVVGYLGDWRPAAAVLFERESLQRDIKSSRKKRQEVTTDAKGGVGATGKWVSPNGEETIGTIKARDYKGLGNQDLEDGRGLAIRPHAVSQPISIDAECNARTNQFGTLVRGGEGGTQQFVAQPIAFKVRGGCEGGGKGYLGQEERAFTISTMQDQQIAQPIAVDTYNQTINEHTSQTIRSDSKADQIGAVLQPIAVDTYNYTTNEHTAQTIRSASDTEHIGAVLQTMAIRRLTPKECERLQGFPDDWTQIPYRNKPADQCPDGPRYKACGNSMAVPVMRWIGQRIQLIDTIIN